MTYAELYRNVAANLANDQHFAIQVCSTHDKRGSVDTEWEIYVARSPDALFAKGATAAEAYTDFLAQVNPREQEHIDHTSAAVGDAEVE